MTQLRSAIRKLLMLLLGTNLGAKVRLALRRHDDYLSVRVSRPVTGTTRRRRDELVDALVGDVKIAVEDPGRATNCSRGGGRGGWRCWPSWPARTSKKADDGMFRIAQAVAKDRIISTVDIQARHGHKSHDRRFDGYKTHLSIDPDSELIDETAVTAANAADHDAVDDLLAPVARMPDKPDVFADSAYADGDNLVPPGRPGFQGDGQGPRRPRPGRPLLQGRFRYRSRCRDGRLPGRAGGAHPLGSRRRRVGQLRAGLWLLPAGPRTAPPTRRGGPSASTPTSRTGARTVVRAVPGDGKCPPTTTTMMIVAL